MGSIEDSIQKLKDLERSWPDLPWNEQAADEADLDDADLKATGLRLRAISTAGATTAKELEPAAPRVVPVQERPDSESVVVVPAERVPLDESDAVPPSPAEDAGARVVQMDLAQLERNGFLVRPRTRSPLAEEFRHIKRPLIENARSSNAVAERLALIMVTSALPGEGKTFFATNLALSIAAEVDMSVLLVEADVIRPDLITRLGVTGRTGLLDLLTDPSLRLEDVVIQTNVPKLSILSAGRANSMATELLASEAMEKLLVFLAERQKYTMVIFDCPPLLVTNEAKVLAARLGQVLMVVEASRTPRASLTQAFAALEQCPIVMSVLNRASEPGEQYGYGYYHQR